MDHSHEQGIEFRSRSAKDWLRGPAIILAAAVLAVGLLATDQGQRLFGASEAATEAASATATQSFADQQAAVDQAVAQLVRVNGPYAASAAATAETTLVPQWLVAINGPYADGGSAAVPANVR